MDIAIVVLQLILSLAILVTLHECGHFFPAKWFKTRVEKFYLFFNPYFSLWKKQIGETEYGIGWIPFGGYVKISGMIDESMDKEQMKGPMQPWEFRAKPAWQRLIIMIGGVTVNFILGFLIFAGMLMYYGTSYITSDSVKHGIHVHEMGELLGLEDGDKIIRIGERQFDRFEPTIITSEIIFNKPDGIEVMRDGRKVLLPIPNNIVRELTKHKNKDKSLFSVRTPFGVADVPEGGRAYDAGLRKGDEVLAIDGASVPFIDNLQDILRDSTRSSLGLTVLRGIDTISLDVTLDETRKLGVLLEDSSDFLKIEKERYSLGEALVGGYDKSVGFLSSQIKAFGKIFKNEIRAKDSLGSIVSIATMFDSSWNWQRFWQITAMLSILLGFFNLLPIPALDGGYVMFLLWEVITGRPVSDKVMEYANTAGFILLMALMVYALGLDFSRFF